MTPRIKAVFVTPFGVLCPGPSWRWIRLLDPRIRIPTIAIPAGAGGLSLDWFGFGLAKVIVQIKAFTAAEPFPWLDRVGLADMLAGTLITLFTSFSHVDIPGHVSIQVNQHIGVPLLIAALDPLVGDVQ